MSVFVKTRWALAVHAAGLLLAARAPRAEGTAPRAVPPDQRGTISAERFGTHDANNIRTRFWNFGMVGDYPPDPANVDLSIFHSMETPKGSGMNYSDGVTPFHFAFALFRLAVIFEGIAARAQSGNAVSDNAAEVGQLGRVFAARAVEVLEGSL